MSEFPAPHRLILFAAALLAPGCREGAVSSAPADPPVPVMLEAKVMMERTGISALVTLAVDAPAGMAKIGSFTGVLGFDPTVLAFADEMPMNDGVLRAANPARGIVRVAGVSAGGIATARLASFRFVVLDTTRATGLRFDVAELHETTRGDLLPRLQRTHSTVSP
jgi:hypothetical protein